MSIKRLYKIILVFFIGLLLLGIGYVYSIFYGNPVVKLIAKHHIQEYVQLKYPENYSMGKVTYNFKTQNYSSVVRDNNNKKYTDIEYRNHSNVVSDIYEKELTDWKEVEILNDKLNNAIPYLLKKMNFGFENIMCDSSVCINANQKFEAMKDLDRYDMAFIQIITKNEINKDEFAEMTLAIIPEIKANMYFREGSRISITYPFEKYDIEFSLKESDINLTKEYIVENTTIKAY